MCASEFPPEIQKSFLALQKMKKDVSLVHSWWGEKKENLDYLQPDRTKEVHADVLSPK